MTHNGRFNSPTKGEILDADLVRELVDFMNEDHKATYKLVIGTDSRSKKYNGKFILDLVTAVVIHRQGRGGRYFWKKLRDDKTKSNVIRNKIYQETLTSLKLAEKLVPDLKQQLNGHKYSLEIHIDVGESGPTRDMIKEVVGMVTGNGYTAKTKPEGFGAFVVADRHT